ncbi:aminoacyl-tRNA hydrolase [Desulfurivibrio alkaliphilus]|uniref:Peptidyl-tRNA hydrolase n=1 Tax=Desulfurivibrio alkaliphilus (strain DSM 19089 / UNIQEM U267 / AHT2) TaxID=589865 RepID=D6Z153_DESAT|nr:aminoacyl-tRNA hydrolase [Desulfurivibrio alkaliphilus]ADH85308.1 peptidyl-tRNA hydrolase [Desulfurivibrio alkaliphilus AHT 2]
MRLLVGLGNPGGEYELTRHNVGFIFTDYLADRHGISLKNEKKWDAEVGRGTLWGQPVMLVKPLTYMNRSGLAVGKIARFFQLEPTSVVVFQDELDLPLGACRLVQGRGAGGHNGIKSLMDHLASRDFVRFRIGVGRPPAARAAAGFVLARFSPAELQVVDKLLPFLEEGVEMLLKRDLQAAMNLVNASTGADLQESV